MALALSFIRASTRAGLAAPLPALRAGSRVLPAVPRATPFPDMSKQDLTIRKQSTAVVAPSAGIGGRFAYTLEVLVSKIFPAGAGWQASSVYVADQMYGLGADTAGFALITGIGDGSAVVVGHSLFYGIKNGFSDFGAQVQTGVWLGTAAFMAGGIWQPAVNAFSGMGFNPCLAATGGVCAAFFFAGLRLGRMVYGSVFSAIPSGTGANMSTDAQLSVAIGGGTACFVGTDVSFGDANWLRGIVGIEETTADLLGCAKAGTSTFLGFAALQTVQNVAVPAKSCWTDI